MVTEGEELILTVAHENLHVRARGHRDFTWIDFHSRLIPPDQKLGGHFGLIYLCASIYIYIYMAEATFSVYFLAFFQDSKAFLGHFEAKQGKR